MFAYSQLVVALITGRRERTFREWSTQGKITCCRGLTNNPYYTVRSLEICLSRRERGEV